MEKEIKLITDWINHLLAPLALQLLHALHIQPADYDHPIPEYVVMSLLVFVIGTILAVILRARLSVDRPGTFQQAAELLITNSMGFGIKDLLDENITDHPEKHIPLVGSVAIFILLSNLMSLVPAFSAPTSIVYVPLAAAIITFIDFNWQGFRHHGFGHYLLSFAGFPKHPADWGLAILLFPVELISTAARLLSLTVRLWANIFASDLLYITFLSLLIKLTLFGWSKFAALGVILAALPIAVPMAFIALHIFVSIVQAYVFTVLPAIYIGIATADDH
jgi:F-type H+-transporting ATPase subunit a